MAGIFVSHAWADGEFVRAFVDEVLCLGCGVARRNVFFSYDPDTGITVGADVNDVVQKHIAAEDTLVLAMLTPTYLARPYCMAELGAAWSGSGALFPLMLPRMGHQDLDGVLRGALVKSVGDPGALDALKERIVATLGVESPATTWGRSRDRWIAKLDEHLRGVAVPSTDEAVSSAACSREQGHMEVFWTDKAANVFYRWWLGANGWSKVHRMTDVEANYVTTVASDGKEMLFGVKPSGEVWMREWQLNDEGWMVAGEVQGIAGLVCGPLAAIARGGELELFAWSQDGKRQLHTWRQQNPERWMNWTDSW